MRVLHARARRRALPVVALFIAIAAGGSMTPAATGQRGSYDGVVCYSQFQDANPGFTLPNENPLGLDQAMDLFRFHRRNEAVAKLDAALKLVAGPWRHRVPIDQRRELTADLEAFRRCVATSPLPEMAILTVRVARLEFEGAPPGGRDAPAAGATVLVEGVPVGRTLDDGTLTVQVPSGEIHVIAEIPPTHRGEEYVSLASGASGSVSIGLHDGKEVTEDTRVVLVEAVDDIIPATSASFTLEFVREEESVPIAEVDRIELSGRDGELGSLEHLFRVVDGAMVATDTAALFAAMAARLDETIALTAYATDAAGLAHVDQVRFRVGQSRLVVTLAAPPSTPALRVAGVEVVVSIMGAGIAVQRVSDAAGRFEIDSFPHGTIAFDAEVKEGGRYYYGQATMAHFGQRAVTLVLRHVSDVVNGVPALEMGLPTAERPPTPRRPGGATQER